MEFPPYLPTFSSFQCPVCWQKFSSHLLKDRCNCPYCQAVLISNVSKAFREGLWLFFILMALWIPLAWPNWQAFKKSSTLVTIIGYYAGQFWYHARVCIWVDPEDHTKSRHSKAMESPT
jgi:hypothetical protein